MSRALDSLSNRIFLASALLATLSIGAAVYFVSARVRSEVEAELDRDLQEAASLVDQQRATLFDSFVLTARLLADLPTVKAALSTGDAPTVDPLIAGYREQVGADLLLATDPAGVPLATAAVAGVLAEGLERAPGVARALDGEPAVAYWPNARGVLQLVSVPVTIGLDRPELLGSLTVGYLLDDDRAERFKQLTGADVAFALDGRIRSSTLGAAADAALVPLLGATPRPRVLIGDAEYAALARPLSPPAGVELAGGPGTPIAVVLRSRTERMRTLSAIQTALAGLALATVLAAVAVSYGVARTITRPLAALTAHMREVAATGDLTRKLPVDRRAGWADGDVRVLATTFNTLTDSVARFQREASQRERLSSLGRMSTVVAHEIRNPLMIIKGALRHLARPGASPEDIRDAAADIDGETRRLNRVVTEVLDFARPIRVEAAPTDVNAVCEQAIAAVTAAEPDPPVSARLTPGLPLLGTDGERLRTVLVNLLANARQAVTAAPGHDLSAGAPVTLATHRAEGGRIVITIADRGIGVPPDDLPRIFDPYFTTRRAGTGLGLPIAKNIVEALGGALDVTSRPGAGTEIRVTLGDAPAPRTP
ncbi:MAG: ATP-binding protein [Vicinamibacterales bacterium]